MSDYIYMNGYAFSWESSILTIGTERFTGITNVSYGQKRERGKGWGMNRSHRPTRRTSGKYTPNPLKMKGFADTIQSIKNYLMSLAPDLRSYGNVIVPITFQLYEPTLGQIHRNFLDCTIDEETNSHEESPDPTQDEIQFDHMGIFTNGGTLWDSTKGF